MELVAPLALWLMLVMPDGQVRSQFIEQQTSDACFTAARQFVLHEPKQFGAIAIAAGCVVHPEGKTSQKE